MTPKDSVNISDFDYPLPDERIARFPADERDASRLLVYRRGALSETRFRGIGGELPEGAVVCCDVTVESADGIRKTLSCPDAELTRQGIDEGDTVCLLPDGTLHKL